MKMEIRELKRDEIEAATKLIWETFLEFVAPDYSEQGVESFRRFIFDESAAEELEFFGAFENDELIGVLSANGDGHICCFFVKASRQGRGVGRSLWEYYRDRGCRSAFTVNSSPYATPVYHSLGFKDAAAERLSDGIRYTPMKYEK